MSEEDGEKTLLSDLAVRDPWDLENKLAEYLRDKMEEERSEVYSADLSPSMITSEQGRCDRYLAYKATGAPRVPKFSVPTLKRFASGTVMHDLYQKWISDIYGDRVVIEISGSLPELQMRMKGDGQLDGKYGLEIKTTSSRQFNKIARSGKPRRSDRDQTLFYFEAFGWETCTFFYINMDGLHDWETVVSAGPGILEDIETERVIIRADPKRFDMYRRRILERVLAPIEEGELPLRYQGSWCRTCPYREVCLEGDQEGII